MQHLPRPVKNALGSSTCKGEASFPDLGTTHCGATPRPHTLEPVCASFLRPDFSSGTPPPSACSFSRTATAKCSNDSSSWFPSSGDRKPRMEGGLARFLLGAAREHLLWAPLPASAGSLAIFTVPRLVDAPPRSLPSYSHGAPSAFTSMSTVPL